MGRRRKKLKKQMKMKKRVGGEVKDEGGRKVKLKRKRSVQTVKETKKEEEIEDCYLQRTEIGESFLSVREEKRREDTKLSLSKRLTKPRAK